MSVSTTIPWLPCLQAACSEGPLALLPPGEEGQGAGALALPWPAWQETCPDRLSPGREAEIKALGV